MPTSNDTYNQQTTGRDVVSNYGDRANDRIILITGANPGGIGLSSAVSLANASPKLLILAGRTLAKLEETAEEIKKTNPNVAVKLIILDLSSQESCRKAAREILDAEDVPQVDILINNAGVMDIAQRTLSPEGIEMQFATNHIGHFLFTNLILPKVVASAQKSAAGSSRIINLSSRAVVYGPVRFSDWNFTKREADLPQSEHMSMDTRKLWDRMEDEPYTPQAAYGQSKVASVLFTRELNKRLFDKTGILSVAVHPGAIKTNLGRHIAPEKLAQVFETYKKMATAGLYTKDLDEGCSTSLVAALDPKLGTDDYFMADCQVANWAPQCATDEKVADQLWKLSEGLVRQQFL